MKTIKFALLIALAAAPLTLFAACGGDDSNPVGPQNKPDTGTPDTYVPPVDGGGGDTGMKTDSGSDSGYNVCAKGITFDNTRVPGYPNPPQP